MKENLKIWNELKAVPSEAKKKIGGGRLKGMTDISPQWRLQAMTEQFGPIGIGWYYDPVDRWTEDYTGEVSVYVSIKMYIKTDDGWSAPISGIGGSKLIAKESSGPHHSDEAYKMATTDALSVAMKQLGVAADVYMGLSDSKYDKPVENAGQPQEKPREKPREIKQADNKQRSYLKDYLSKFKDKNDVKAIDYINEALVNPNLTELEANTIINHCKTKLGE